MLLITPEQIQAKFDSLPEDLKWIIASIGIDEKVFEIGKKNALTIEQIGKLAFETYLIIFGFTHFDKFNDSLGKSLECPDEKIDNIINDINNYILKPIREKQMISTSTETKTAIEEKISKEETSALLNTLNEKSDNLEKTMTEESITEEQDIVEPYSKELKSLGIEISEKDKNHEDTTKSILSRRLTSSFRMPVTKTDYSSHDITNVNTLGTGKTNQGRAGIPKPPAQMSIGIGPKELPQQKSMGIGFQHVGSQTTQLSPSFHIKEDPYRLKIE